MNRRGFVTAIAAGAAALAGCSSDEDDPEDPNEQSAARIAGLLEDHEALTVQEWGVAHELERYFLHFQAEGSSEDALRGVAATYADGVDDGLEYLLSATEFDDDGEEVRYFEIEVEWAESYLAGQHSEDDYLARIETTME